LWDFCIARHPFSARLPAGLFLSSIYFGLSLPCSALGFALAVTDKRIDRLLAKENSPADLSGHQKTISDVSVQRGKRNVAKALAGLIFV
jgi:hypothetical protein